MRDRSAASSLSRPDSRRGAAGGLEGLDVMERPQTALLRQIKDLSGRVRILRRTDAVANNGQIKGVEGQLSAKWQELRVLRAGSVKVGDVPREGSHLHYHLLEEG